MNITVTGRHFEVTEPIKAYAEDKAAKLPHFFDRTQSVEVVIGQRGSHLHDVELIAHVDGHEPFVAHSRDDDVYAAIDMTEDKLGKQLRRHKDRLLKRQRA
ncbi:MAG: ribosome-associated translation inhibitor RaiA [Algisphaera sp.]